MTYDTVVIGGGQSGLATAYHLERAGLGYLVLNDSEAPTGSWPRYYDSLRLFSPAAYSSLPGMAFPGDPSRLPLRDEVVAYLRAYADRFSLKIRNNTHVTRVRRNGETFEIRTASGDVHHAHTVVAATGPFNVPHVPDIPGRFERRLLHAIEYRDPTPFAGQRVVVVGAANTAVQIAMELASTSRVTLAVRGKVRFAPQRVLGKDIHFWLQVTGLDRTGWLKDQRGPVLDDGTYRRALDAGMPDVRPMFERLSPKGVVWADGNEEPVDAVIFATGYQPNLDYLADCDGTAPPNGGVSHAAPGLFYVGFAGQRSFSSATLRGVGRDAGDIVQHIQTWVARLRKGVDV